MLNRKSNVYGLLFFWLFVVEFSLCGAWLLSCFQRRDFMHCRDTFFSFSEKKEQFINFSSIRFHSLKPLGALRISFKMVQNIFFPDNHSFFFPFRIRRLFPRSASKQPTMQNNSPMTSLSIFSAATLFSFSCNFTAAVFFLSFQQQQTITTSSVNVKCSMISIQWWFGPVSYIWIQKQISAIHIECIQWKKKESRTFKICCSTYNIERKTNDNCISMLPTQDTAEKRIMRNVKCSD